MTTKRALENRLRRLVSRDPLLRSAREGSRETSVPVWLVGGVLRDAAMGESAQDVDLAAGRGARLLVQWLEAAWKHHGYRFRKRGVTTFRFVVEGREVDLVDAGGRGLERDLLRREFTINAMAFDLLEGRLVDPSGGLRDLRARRLRLPRPGVLREDPIRALRIARFLAQLPGFRLHPQARAEAASVAPALRRASVERIRDELDQLLVSRAPERGFEVMEELGLIGLALPELVPLRSCPAGEGRPDAWRHTLEALAQSARPAKLPGARATRDPEGVRALRWALLLHDMAKPSTLRWEDDGRPTFHGHEVLGSRGAKALLKRLRLPGALCRRVSRLILFHLRPHHLADAGAPERGMRRLVREAEEDLPLLVLHAACDAKASSAPDGAARWKRLRPVLVRLLSLRLAAGAQPPLRLVDGRDVMAALGIPPGPEVGRVLRELRELQEQGTITDRARALGWLASRRFSRRRRGSARSE